MVSGGGGDFPRAGESHFEDDRRQTGDFVSVSASVICAAEIKCSMHVGFIPNPSGSCF